MISPVPMMHIVSFNGGKDASSTTLAEVSMEITTESGATLIAMGKGPGGIRPDQLRESVKVESIRVESRSTVSKIASLSTTRVSPRQRVVVTRVSWAFSAKEQKRRNAASILYIPVTES
jgi:hypothetical protein